MEVFMSGKVIACRTILICAVTGVLLQASVAFAKPKPKTKTYPASCATVWEITKATVQEHYDVLSLNDQTQSGSFTTGSAWTGVRPIAFSLSGSGDSCTVAVTGHFSGLIHNDKGDFFKRIEEDLNRRAVQASSGKPSPVSSQAGSPTQGTAAPASPVTLEAEEVRPVATEAQGQTALNPTQPASQAEGTMSVTSDPPGAEIFVDSVSYGRTPKIVNLSAGKHMVQLVMPGYRDWASATSLDAGSIVNVTATLEH